MGLGGDRFCFGEIINLIKKITGQLVIKGCRDNFFFFNEKIARLKNKPAIPNYYYKHD